MPPGRSQPLCRPPRQQTSPCSGRPCRRGQEAASRPLSQGRPRDHCKKHPGMRSAPLSSFFARQWYCCTPPRKQAAPTAR
eukprot:scaffold56818_cov59-Phaeocystis_antarctica.AAC.3